MVEDTSRMDVFLLFAKWARADYGPWAFQIGRQASLNERVWIRGRIDGRNAIGQDGSELFRRVRPVAGLFQLVDDTNYNVILDAFRIHF